MKNIILLILLSFGVQLFAKDDIDGIKSVLKCGPGRLRFMPYTKEISLNPIFIITGYGCSKKTLNNLNNRKFYIESAQGEIIELKLEIILKGIHITQAMFKPKKELTPQTTYFLKFQNETAEETKEKEGVFWRTIDKKYVQNLTSDIEFEFKNKPIMRGCGTSAMAIFNVKNRNNKNIEIIYKTELIAIDTNVKQTHYIIGSRGELAVGHGKCGGAFYFESKKYKVRFTPMNIDGVSLKTTKWFFFDSPE